MVGSFDAASGKPLLYDFGMESRAAALAALGRIDAYVTVGLMPEEAAGIRATKRQFRPG